MRGPQKSPEHLGNLRQASVEPAGRGSEGLGLAGRRDGLQAARSLDAGCGPGTRNSWMQRRVLMTVGREASPGCRLGSHRRGGAPDTHQTDRMGSCLLQGCPSRGWWWEMKACCPNCNRQPISNALAASTSGSAAPCSRLGKAWADGCLRAPWEGLPWQAEPGASEDPEGPEPKSVLH